MTREEAIAVLYSETTTYQEQEEAVRIAVEALKEQRPHGEWIPCSERLPEEGVNHLGWIERDSWVDGDDYPTRKQEIAIGWHIEGRWHFDGCNGKTKCIAWMPLPEPYREEGDSDA